MACNRTLRRFGKEKKRWRMLAKQLLSPWGGQFWRIKNVTEGFQYELFVLCCLFTTIVLLTYFLVWNCKCIRLENLMFSLLEFFLLLLQWYNTFFSVTMYLFHQTMFSPRSIFFFLFVLYFINESFIDETYGQNTCKT